MISLLDVSVKTLTFSNSWYWFLLAAVVCYFIGCFNFAVLISHFKKSDIRGVGSGNPGSMNMTRTFGLKIGAINFFCDAIKGGLPALVAWLIFKDYVFEETMVPPPPGMGYLGFSGGVSVADFARYFFGMFVIIGHVFPVTMKFKGGKGIASTMGLFLFSLPCEQWWYFFIVAAFFCLTLLYIALTEWGSMGSLFGVSGLTIWQACIFVIRYEAELADVHTAPVIICIFMMLLVINLLTWLRHSTNIYKLLAGEEHRTAVLKHKKR